MILTGWGRYPRISAKLNVPCNEKELRELVLQGHVIARGNGRAYGDSAVSVQNTVHMRRFNRILLFDAEKGQLVVEAGVLLADIIDAFLPRGWFPYVTPGTKFVTVGGMIAADVHGKNHHKDGSFGAYVDWIDVVVSDGSIVRCSRSENSELFEWTVGGMGLTGVVLRAAMRLRPITSAWINQRTLVAENLSHVIELFEQSNDATYSVAWIDCLKQGKAMGRSLVMLGEHADAAMVPSKYRKTPLHTPQKRKRNIPVEFPSFALNSLSVRAFNAFYHWNGRRKPEKQLVDWDSYFYPLDTILGWNKIYGRSGFAQFQCVLPTQSAEEGLRALLSATSSAGAGSFLAVLKRFGTQESRFSFPMKGYTLALDFPVSERTLMLMERLDNITMEYGGRFYLAKDSRMSSDVFQVSEPRSKDYTSFRDKHLARETFSSAQSERLGL